MCGIVGQINFKGEMVNKDELEIMRDTMIHRGPDDSGMYCHGNVGLGFRRLSIIDLSGAGSQPMCNENGSIWLVFNGEIYNFDSLRKDLLSKGHKFKSTSDSEVLIHSYEEQGINFLKKINGMFALAIYDQRANRLILARDRLGVKPLYYYHDGKKLIFASELKAVLGSKSINKELSHDGLVDYLRFGYVLEPDSIFKGIKKVKPAEYYIWDCNTGSLVKNELYWKLLFKNRRKWGC